MMGDDATSLRRRLWRAARLRCPRCGARGMWRTWFAMHHACPNCGQRFERGEDSDFWVGAYLINLVVAETSAIAIAAAMWLTFGASAPFRLLWGASMALVIVTPMLFYPFSRTLWLAIDIHFRPAEAGDYRSP